MAWFLCAYPPWPDETIDTANLAGSYSSFIWAKDRAHALRLAKQRRIGEVVVWQRGNRGRPFLPPSIQLRRRRLTPRQKLDVIHGAVFLMFLVMRVKGCAGPGVHAVLGDEGALHSLVHHLSTGWPRRQTMVRMLEGMERMVPGYWPHPKKNGRAGLVRARSP